MTLARAWTRRVYGASFVALLVPGAVLGSLAVLAMAGGLGRLGAIGQVFSGPAVPSAPAAARARPAATGTATVRRVARRTPAGAGTRAAAPPTTGSAAPSGGRGVLHRGSPSGATATPIAGGGTGGGAAGGGTGGGGTSGAGHLPGPPAPTPTPRPSPQPTLTDRVVATARSVTSRVPGAAGQIATGAVNTVGSIADKLLPGNGTGSQGPRAGTPLGGLP
jgi:hypothetical protein